jgi:predicted pyridoxine 5'-phosphate oxidase superfamily flavin-nucleotide-binding protein
MGKVYPSIDGRLREFLLAQPVFFVATAPAEGHVNVSPKGMRGTFAVLDGRRVAYLDYTGSGVETIAHLRDNGRITLMFCAFDGPPKIVRLHGCGEAVRPADPRFADLRRAFPEDHEEHGLRSVIVVDVERISDSCGFAVPLMQYEGERGLLTEWAGRKSPEDLVTYRRERNAASIDGLPALDEELGSAHEPAPAST